MLAFEFPRIQKAQWIIRPKFHVSRHCFFCRTVPGSFLFISTNCLSNIFWISNQVLGHLLQKIRSQRSLGQWAPLTLTVECWFFGYNAIIVFSFGAIILACNRSKERIPDSFIASMTKMQWCGWRVSCHTKFMCILYVLFLDICHMLVLPTDSSTSKSYSICWCPGVSLGGHQAFDKQRRWCLKMTKLRHDMFFFSAPVSTTLHCDGMLMSALRLKPFGSHLCCRVLSASWRISQFLVPYTLVNWVSLEGFTFSRVVACTHLHYLFDTLSRLRLNETAMQRAMWVRGSKQKQKKKFRVV